ncbi:MAG: helix-turn-helix transcriptional regulator, partial [Aquirufa sp.]
QVKKITGIPLLLKEYNNGWYTGWYLLFQPASAEDTLIRLDLNQLRVFALDRITGIRVVKKEPKIRKAADFQPADYFNASLGVFRSSTMKAETIRIEVLKSSWMFNYLLKYPIHASQQLSEEQEDSAVFQYKLEIEQELENFLIRYAAEMRILAPEKLKISIQNQLQETLHKHV